VHAAARTSLALAAKRQRPAASLFARMVTAQAVELLLVVLCYIASSGRGCCGGNGLRKCAPR
jgi:hypothetical protein